MKKTVYGIMGATLLALTLTGCVKDDLFDSPLCAKSALIVKAQIQEEAKDVETPMNYNLAIEGETYVAKIGKEYLVPVNYEPGNYKFMAYNTSEGLELDGTKMSVETLADGSMFPQPQCLFSSRKEVSLVKDDTTRVDITLMQRMQPLELYFRVMQGNPDKIASLTATLTNFAKSYDIDREARTGETGSYNLNFERCIVDGRLMFYAGVMSFGVVGDSQMLKLTINYTNGEVDVLEYDIAEMLKDYGTDENMCHVFMLRGGIRSQVEASMGAEIVDWEVQIGEVEIR